MRLLNILHFTLSLQSFLKESEEIMKKDLHPEYKQVVFLDTTSDFKFMTRSTMTSDETIKWEDGNE